MSTKRKGNVHHSSESKENANSNSADLVRSISDEILDHAVSGPGEIVHEFAFDVTNPKYLEPFNHGFKREVVYRFGTNFADIYYHAPNDDKMKTGLHKDLLMAKLLKQQKEKRNQRVKKCRNYHFTKEGNLKLRSLIDVDKFLKSSLLSHGLTRNNFTYKRYPLGINDTEKEIIRTAAFSRANRLRKAQTRQYENKRQVKKNPGKKLGVATSVPPLAQSPPQTQRSRVTPPKSGTKQLKRKRAHKKIMLLPKTLEQVPPTFQQKSMTTRKSKKTLKRNSMPRLPNPFIELRREIYPTTSIEGLLSEENVPESQNLSCKPNTISSNEVSSSKSKDASPINIIPSSTTQDSGTNCASYQDFDPDVNSSRIIANPSASSINLSNNQPRKASQMGYDDSAGLEKVEHIKAAKSSTPVQNAATLPIRLKRRRGKWMKKSDQEDSTDFNNMNEKRSSDDSSSNIDKQQIQSQQQKSCSQTQEHSQSGSYEPDGKSSAQSNTSPERQTPVITEQETEGKPPIKKQRMITSPVESGFVSRSYSCSNRQDEEAAVSDPLQDYQRATKEIQTDPTVTSSSTLPTSLQQTQLDLVRDLRNLLIDDEHSDITFISPNEHKFRAHKSIIKVRAPSLYAMFKLRPEKREVRFTGISDAVFVKLMEFIYTGVLPDTNDLTLELYHTAEELAMPDLAQKCLAALGDGIVIRNVADVLIIARFHGNSRLEDKAIQFIQANLHEFIGIGGLERLRPHPILLEEIIRHFAPKRFPSYKSEPALDIAENQVCPDQSSVC